MTNELNKQVTDYLNSILSGDEYLCFHTSNIVILTVDEIVSLINEVTK